MDNEELERIMNFIIERQEYTAAQLAKITERQDRWAERSDEHEERIARFERSYVAISQLLQKHDSQLVAVTDVVNDWTDRLAKLTVRSDEHEERTAELERSHATISRLLERLAARADDHDERIARLEQSNAVIVRLLEKHNGQLEKQDDQLVVLTDGLNKLTALVDRYIAARGNGGNGGGGA